MNDTLRSSPNPAEPALADADGAQLKQQMADRGKKFTFGDVSLDVTAEPTYDEWAEMGPHVGRRERASKWWLGDWINYGEASYGEKYAQALAHTGLSYDTLRGAAWVASKFETVRRRTVLEWWPHHETAGLEIPEQGKVLDEVEAYVRQHPEHDHPRRAEVREQVQRCKRERVVESLAEMRGKFRVVYADPPWQYHDSGASTEGSFGKAEDHYPTMSTEAIATMPVKDHVRPNAVLFLWVTEPMRFEAKAVIDGWGFTHKAAIVWDKDDHGLGHYVSVRHEHLLICTRGSCTPAPEDLTPMIDSVQTITRGRRRHSEKPEEFRQIIDRLYPNGPKLEMFGRREVAGWTVYGNQVAERL